MNKNYSMTNHRMIIIFSFLLLFLLPTKIGDNIMTELLYLKIFFTIILVILFILSFNIKINNTKLSYKITFFKMTVYNKDVYPNQIEKIKFKGINGLNKHLIIQRTKGMNLRVIHSNPKVYEELSEFAKSNNIIIQ